MHIFNLKICIFKLEIVFMSAGNVCYGFLPPKKDFTEKVSAMTYIQWHSPFPPGNFE